MHPELFTIPVLGINVKTYSFCLMVGFLSAVWFGMRRAERVKANPDRILDICFLSLIFGVAGSRVFYVIHYWESQFADAPNKLMAILDIREGGLEFIGGLLGAFVAVVIYLRVTKQSMRLYMDLMAPATMWGLAFGRIGCFFNGCCYGGLCVTAATGAPAYPWAVQFPFGSPAQVRQWEERKVTVPAELVRSHSPLAYLLSASTLNLPVETVETPKRNIARIKKALADSAEAPPEVRQQLEGDLKAAEQALAASKRKNRLDDLEAAQLFPSRVNPDRKTSQSELQDLAHHAKSLPVHPTQLYAAVHAMILSGLLSAVLYRRKRHGMVIGLMFLLYPIGRLMLETIRVDNPLDSAGLTISQFLSVLLFVAAAGYLLWLYKKMPVRSPAVDAQVAADREKYEKKRSA